MGGDVVKVEELFKAAQDIDRFWRMNHSRIGQHVSQELAACECIHAAGGQDAQSGDVDSPTGYFYRVDRWIVVVDTLGFLYLHEYQTEDEASKAFGVLDDKYSEWDNAYVEL